MQAVDEPHQLFLGDVGIAQVEGDGLTADDTTQNGGGDGALPAQVNLSPQPFVTTPERDTLDSQTAVQQVGGSTNQRAENRRDVTHQRLQVRQTLMQTHSSLWLR